MPRPYPNPQINNTELLVEHVQTLTNGLMLPLICFAIWIIIFLITRSKIQRISDSALVSSFLTFIISSLFAMGNFIPWKYPIIFIGIMVFSGIFTYIED